MIESMRVNRRWGERRHMFTSLLTFWGVRYVAVKSGVGTCSRNRIAL